MCTCGCIDVVVTRDGEVDGTSISMHPGPGKVETLLKELQIKQIILYKTKYLGGKFFMDSGKSKFLEGNFHRCKALAFAFVTLCAIFCLQQNSLLQFSCILNRTKNFYAHTGALLFSHTHVQKRPHSFPHDDLLESSQNNEMETGLRELSFLSLHVGTVDTHLGKK